MLYGNPFPLVDVTVIPDDEILRHKRIALLELVQKHIWQRDLLELLEPLAHLPRIVNSATDEQLESLVNYMLSFRDFARNDVGVFYGSCRNNSQDLIRQNTIQPGLP